MLWRNNHIIVVQLWHVATDLNVRSHGSYWALSGPRADVAECRDGRKNDSGLSWIIGRLRAAVRFVLDQVEQRRLFRRRRGDSTSAGGSETEF
jgi:hypothetical protein